MLSRLNIILQHIVPQHFLSQCMFKLTRVRWAPFKNLFIKTFIRIYDVDMSLANETDATVYESFNAFFTRSLKSSVRPCDADKTKIVSPVDGSISQVGSIQSTELLQAKGKNYSLSALLANENRIARRFDNGNFTTIYLSPRDYHRIHMPFEGTLEEMIYIPGDLFSVNTATVDEVDNLFARNERVVCLFEAAIGKMAVIFVGAIFVGSMETVWEGQITPARERELRFWRYDRGAGNKQFVKGDELGRFNMGSTVILLFENNAMDWHTDMVSGRTLKMGEAMGSLK